LLTYLLKVDLIMFGCSSREAAKRLGISFASLNRYIADEKIPLPPLVKVGGVSVRLWSDADIERVRALLPKIANGRKTQYQKQRQKQPARKPKR
jgi:predicted DNA-binding transcriptional regulator AlpA